MGKKIWLALKIRFCFALWGVSLVVGSLSGVGLVTTAIRLATGAGAGPTILSFGSCTITSDSHPALVLVVLAAATAAFLWAARAAKRWAPPA